MYIYTYSILEQKYLLRRAKRDIVWLIHTMIRTTFIIDSGVGVAGGVARFLDITSSILSHAAYVVTMTTYVQYMS